MGCLSRGGATAPFAIREGIAQSQSVLQQTLHGGLVKVWTLPTVQPGPAGAELLLKRVMLPQGELAQIHDSDEPMRYIAAIGLRAGTVRGNHYHKLKKEYVYVVTGRLTLILKKIDSELHESTELTAGGLALISPSIIHALQVKEDGLAIEFSPQRFDPADTFRGAHTTLA